MTWLIEFDKEAEKELKKLDLQIGRRILKVLRSIAELEDPRSVGQALSGSKLGNDWKYCVGDLRIIADIQDERLGILVVRLGNRRDIDRNQARQS